MCALGRAGGFQEGWLPACKEGDWAPSPSTRAQEWVSCDCSHSLGLSAKVSGGEVGDGSSEKGLGVQVPGGSG